jgi:hypothetical protein
MSRASNVTDGVCDAQMIGQWEFRCSSYGWRYNTCSAISDVAKVTSSVLMLSLDLHVTVPCGRPIEENTESQQYIFKKH